MPQEDAVELVALGDPEAFVQGFEILVDSERVDSSVRHGSSFSPELRERFKESPSGAIHDGVGWQNAIRIESGVRNAG